MLTKSQLRTPVWDTDTVYAESLLFVRNADGIAEAPLLFPPVEILRFTDPGGSIEYEAGRDYTLNGSTVRLTENSHIFAFTEAELYPEQGEHGKTSFPDATGNILFREGRFFPERIVYITYKCRNTWQGIRPYLADKALPRTFAKLRGGEDICVLLNGDSISAGANATALLQMPPYQPDFGTMLYDALTDAYSGSIRYVNTSVGGKGIDWAVKNVQANICDYAPDLVIVGFGMNDGGKTPEEFAAKCRTLLSLVRAKKPETEFLLIATSTPNPRLTNPRAKFWGSQSMQRPELDKIAADTEGVAVADITAMQRELMRSKRFLDLTSNHVNHPNDFFYRCYTHFLSGMLIG